MKQGGFWYKPDGQFIDVDGINTTHQLELNKLYPDIEARDNEEEMMDEMYNRALMNDKLIRGDIWESQPGQFYGMLHGLLTKKALEDIGFKYEIPDNTEFEINGPVSGRTEFMTWGELMEQASKRGALARLIKGLRY